MSYANDEMIGALHKAMLQFRIDHRAVAIGWLRKVAPVARLLARRFSEDEMWTLVEVHARIPWVDMVKIEVGAANVEAEDDDCVGAYSHTLAGHLVRLTHHHSDLRFTLPETFQDLAAAAALAIKVRRLNRADAVALCAILEGCRASPLGILHYPSWWHADMLIKILSNPELDLVYD